MDTHTFTYMRAHAHLHTNTHNTHSHIHTLPHEAVAHRAWTDDIVNGWLLFPLMRLLVWAEPQQLLRMGMQPSIKFQTEQWLNSYGDMIILHTHTSDTHTHTHTWKALTTRSCMSLQVRPNRKISLSLPCKQICGMKKTHIMIENHKVLVCFIKPIVRIKCAMINIITSTVETISWKSHKRAIAAVPLSIKWCLLINAFKKNTLENNFPYKHKYVHKNATQRACISHFVEAN